MTDGRKKNCPFTMDGQLKGVTFVTFQTIYSHNLIS